MVSLRKAPVKVKTLAEVRKVIQGMKIVYEFCEDSKVFEKQSGTELIYTSTDYTMLDYMFYKCGGEFKEGPDEIIYLSIVL